MLTRPAWIAGLSSPKMSLAEAWVNVGSPPIGRYSWSSESSSASNFLACKCQHWRVTESPAGSRAVTLCSCLRSSAGGSTAGWQHGQHEPSSRR